MRSVSGQGRLACHSRQRAQPRISMRNIGNQLIFQNIKLRSGPAFKDTSSAVSSIRQRARSCSSCASVVASWRKVLVKAKRTWIRQVLPRNKQQKKTDVEENRRRGAVQLKL